MIGQGPLQGFRVPARSIDLIRARADAVRRVMEWEMPVNLELALERLTEYSITLDIVENNGGPLPDGIDACWFPEDLKLYMRESVYLAACRGDPRASFTVFHELGHCFLGHRRTLNREPSNATPIKTFEDSEWQANQFAAEIMMPLEIIKREDIKTAADLANRFGASAQSAAYRIRQLIKRQSI